MASQAKEHEIIDLTEPDVIELDSEGEVVDETADVTPGTPNGTGKPGQAKKRRRKRRKKPYGANTPAQEGAEDVGSASAEASRAQSPTLQVENLVNGSGSGSGGTGRKRSLADRLEDVPNEDRRNGKEEDASGGQQRGERRRNKERAEGRERDRHREREHGGERRREQDRRSPRRDREQEEEKDRDGDRPRRRSRSRERDRERRKKKRDKLQAPAPESDAQLFFEDVTPAEIPGVVKPSQSVAGPSNPAVVDLTGDSQSDNALLLPAHVSVTENGEDAEAGPLTVPIPEGSDDDEDYIDYLDYDDDRRAGMVRYWELDKLDAQEAKASKPTRFVCKKCGAEGEHKTYECPVLICLTCGARDEHSTRSCPISKVCFTCGMKGHINRTCPNRGKGGANQSYQDCDRCGARSHRTNECPTLWRMYRYVEDEVRQETLRTREEKRVLPLGQGGEGYIATDEWCYNCGGSGHLGDDCTAIPHHADLPNEHSAFSLYNILSGPFSSEATAARPAKRAPRDWEAAAAFADGYGFTAPMEVGKQGKRKQRDRLERRQRELEDAEDDQDDWFGGGRSRERSGPQDNRGQGRGGGSSKPNGSGKIQFHFTGGGSSQGGGREAKRQRTGYDDLPGPSRETDSIQIRGAARKPSHSSASSRNRSRNRYDYDRDRDSQRGPRYRGGYR